MFITLKQHYVRLFLAEKYKNLNVNTREKKGKGLEFKERNRHGECKRERVSNKVKEKDSKGKRE